VDDLTRDARTRIRSKEHAGASHLADVHIALQRRALGVRTQHVSETRDAARRQRLDRPAEIALTRIFRRPDRAPDERVTTTGESCRRFWSWPDGQVRHDMLVVVYAASGARSGRRKIRVNAISAGPIKTLAARGISGLGDMLRAHAERAPLQCNVDVSEVGSTGVFLASDASSGITGEISTWIADTTSWVLKSRGLGSGSTYETANHHQGHERYTKERRQTLLRDWFLPRFDNFLTRIPADSKSNLSL